MLRALGLYGAIVYLGDAQPTSQSSRKYRIASSLLCSASSVAAATISEPLPRPASLKVFYADMPFWSLLEHRNHM